jgi:hypothetical protein
MSNIKEGKDSQSGSMTPRLRLHRFCDLHAMEVAIEFLMKSIALGLVSFSGRSKPATTPHEV